MDCTGKASKTEGGKLPRQKNMLNLHLEWQLNSTDGKTIDCPLPGTGVSGVAPDSPWSLPTTINVCYWKGTVGMLSACKHQSWKVYFINKCIDVVAIKKQFTLPAWMSLPDYGKDSLSAHDWFIWVSSYGLGTTPVWNLPIWGDGYTLPGVNSWSSQSSPAPHFSEIGSHYVVQLALSS